MHDLMVLAAEPPPNSRIRMMGGVVLGASFTVGALGVFVWQRTEEANKAISEAAAAAAGASVDALNSRRRLEAERVYLDGGVEAGRGR